jgi:glycosyltransferase involved in cell wall biosynthesis
MALRQRLTLDEVVGFCGAAEQADVIAMWQRASVGVLTSEREGMPVSLMEAASCGVPVVATAVGGVPELVEHSVTGLLAPCRDVSALADALQQLLGDPVRRAELGRAARRRAIEHFALERQLNRLCDLWCAAA